MSRVSVIGSGNVGAKAAYCIAERNIADVVMIDVVEGLAESKARDFLHTSAVTGSTVSILGTTEYGPIEDSEVVVLTAGIARKPGMDRMDLLKTNVDIAGKAAREIARRAPESKVVVVTNPLDVISMVVLRETGFPPERVIGMAGILDGTRFRYFIAEACGVWPPDVEAIVLGGHGDSMVPLTRYASAGGVPIAQILDPQTIERLVERTRKGGGEIVQYLKSGSAYYAPGASAAAMALTIMEGTRRLCAASVCLQGEYGYRDIFLGVPIILAESGVEKIVQLELSSEEHQALDRSARAVEDGVRTLDEIYAQRG